MSADARPVLVAPDKFKGTFTAPRVAAAIGRGLERAGLVPPDLCPLADGGEGTLGVLLTALGGETAGTTATDPLGRPVRAGFGLLEDGAKAAACATPVTTGYPALTHTWVSGGFVPRPTVRAPKRRLGGPSALA